MIDHTPSALPGRRPLPATTAAGIATDAHKDQSFEADIVAQLDFLYRAALRLTRHVHDAEDLVQETVARALTYRARFTPGSNLSAWLFTIERSLYFNAYRRKQSAPCMQLMDDVEEATLYGAYGAQPRSSAETVLLHALVDPQITAALDALPRHYRLAVHLADVVGLSYTEMAQAMGCAPGTVMSRLHRGRALLRRALDPRAGHRSARGARHASDTNHVARAA